MHGLDPGTGKGCWGEAVEIWIKSRVSVIVMYECSFLILWLCKMLTLEETGWRVYENSLYYHCNVSINLKLFQNKKHALKRSRSKSHRILQEYKGKNIFF